MPEVDQARAGAFLESMKTAFHGSMLVMMVDLGHRAGLFSALSSGPATVEGLAERTGQSARHLREWLGAMAVAGVVEFDEPSGVFTLPPEHAMWLTGSGYTNLAPTAGMFTGLAPRIDDVIEAFRTGDGVSYEKYRPHFTHAMDALGRAKYDALLVRAYLPKAPGLADALRAGIRAADVGCGTGHCVNILASAFPESSFTGFDIAEDAVALGRIEAETLGLTNTSFEAVDVRHLPIDPPFDALFAFDAIHDQHDPVGVLARMRAGLKPGGTLFMLDIKASSNLVDNMADPAMLVLYGTSVLHCMQVGLHGGGAGLGTVWGTHLATQMLNDAGFASVTIHDLPGDPTNCLYVCS
jgi:2-polyprenyl-3-methyl-5-hydroxy-6-metoxy-1,4-benzoquinol methylase